MNNFFEQMGFNFFDEEAELTPVTPVKEEKKAEKKTDTKKSTVKKTTAKKSNKAKGEKLNLPVTVKGRGFTYVWDGFGETDIQAVAEKLFEQGLTEVAHKRVKFLKTGIDTVILSYEGLEESSGDEKVTLPVNVIDGELKAVYSTNADLNVDEDEDVSVQTLKEVGINNADYGLCGLDYDVTSSLVLPVFETNDFDAEKSGIISGDTIICHGNRATVVNPATVIEDFIGEVPENTKVVVSNGGAGVYFVYLERKNASDAVEVDRTAFGVNEATKTEKVEEKIHIPCEAYIVNFNQHIPVAVEEIGSEKVTWKEFEAHMKGRFRMMRSTDRKIDHMYDAETGTVSIAFFSGSKGGM